MRQESQAKRSSGSIGDTSSAPFLHLLVRGLAHYAWVPIPLLIGGIVILWMIGDPAVVREPPYLLLVLNITFRTAIGIFIAYLAARSFSRNGSLPILALGSGTLIFGLASAVGGVGIHYDQLNLGLTVVNTGFWFSGACHLFAALGTLSHRGYVVRKAPLVLSTAYAAVLLLCVLLVMSAAEGLLPAFYVSGDHRETIRQVVLSSAAGMFALASVVTATSAWRREWMFGQWYSLSLGLIAIGLGAVLIPSAVGSLVGWAGRSALYLGGLYMLCAVLSASRRLGEWDAKLHEALEDSRYRLQTLSEATFEAIVVTENGVIVDVNDRFTDLLGYSKEESLGKAIPVFIPQDYVSQVLQRIEDGGEGIIEHPAIRKDGSIVMVEVHGRTLRRHGRRIRFSAIRDITERKNHERALEKARAELEQRVAERTEELRQRAEQLARLTSELTLTEQRERRRLAQVLHDHLQQLLVGAKYSLSILGRKVAEENREDLLRVEHLLNESIEASRSLTIELSPPILHEGGLSAGLQWLVPWAKEKFGLKVVLEINEEVTVEREDVRLLLFQAVRELLLNSSKYARVSEARVQMGSGGWGQVRVVVEDKGVGFDPEAVLATMAVTGGFGLFSIRERIDFLGGTFTIDSSPGHGSRFILLAPIRSSEHSPSLPLEGPAESGQPVSSESGRGVRDSRNDQIRILLVDDHAVMRQGLSLLLAIEDDIRILGEAADGHEAVRLARELQPDVILMDFSLPGLDGVEATRLIRSEHPGIRIIGLSMYEEKDRAEAMLSAGASSYVTKSGESERLLSAIRMQPSTRSTIT